MLTGLAMTIAGHGSSSGAPTHLPRVSIWTANAPTDPVPALFEPKFYLLLQGAKRLVIGGKTLDFTAGRCAVSSVGLPFTSQVIEASPATPYIGVELRLDAGLVASLVLDMSAAPDAEEPTFCHMQATEVVMDALGRLLGLLNDPADVPVLAPQFERELCYRLLQGPMGGTLRQIVQRSTRFDQIRTAVKWICDNADQPMCVKRLAASVGMSMTSFHRHFKAVTAHSPLAYQRHIRLLDARRKIASGSISVTATAFTMGYASASQFSREYRRMFGVPPSRHTVQVQR